MVTHKNRSNWEGVFAAVNLKPQQLRNAFAYLLRSPNNRSNWCLIFFFPFNMHLFAAGIRQTAAFVDFFFLILFLIYGCVYRKTTANNTQQIPFFSTSVLCSSLVQNKPSFGYFMRESAKKALKSIKSQHST